MLLQMPYQFSVNPFGDHGQVQIVGWYDEHLEQATIRLQLLRCGNVDRRVHINQLGMSNRVGRIKIHGWVQRDDIKIGDLELLGDAQLLKIAFEHAWPSTTTLYDVICPHQLNSSPGMHLLGKWLLFRAGH